MRSTPRFPLFTLVLTLGLVALTSQGLWAADESPLVGKMAPDFEANTLDGKKVKLSSFKDSPVVLDFWASWCPPCKQELPVLKEIYTKLKGQGLKIVAVSIDGKVDDLKKFLQSNPLPFTVLHLPTADVKAVAEAYKLTGIPRVLYVTKQGKVKSDTSGYHEKADILKHIAALGVDTSAAK